MPDLNKTNAQHLIIVFVWICFTVAAFAYFVSGKLVPFDPNEALKNTTPSEFSNYLQNLPLNTEQQTGHMNSPVISQRKIIHFTQTNCKCQQYSEQHIQDINKIAKKENFSVQMIDTNNLIFEQPSLITSVPSIAVLDDVGKLIYFGPYGEGLACSETSGYAQTILNNYLKGFNANLIMNEAKGCYCQV